MCRCDLGISILARRHISLIIFVARMCRTERGSLGRVCDTHILDPADSWATHTVPFCNWIECCHLCTKIHSFSADPGSVTSKNWDTERQRQQQQQQQWDRGARRLTVTTTTTTLGGFPVGIVHRIISHLCSHYIFVSRRTPPPTTTTTAMIIIT